MRNAFGRHLVLVALLSSFCAVPAFASAARGADDADAIVAFAEIAANRGDYATAEKALRDGMAAHPERHGFHLMLGAVLVQSGKLEEGFFELQWEVLRAGANRREGSSAAEISFAVAEKLGAESEAGRFLAALSLIESDLPAARKQIAALPARFAVGAIAADLAWLAGDNATAEKSYRALLAKDPRYVPALVGLANLARARGDEKAAAGFLAKANAIDAQRTAEVMP